MPKPLSKTWTTLLYLVLPTGISLVLIGMYFSQVPWLQSAVSPELNREFGLLENLQLACLALLAILFARATLRARGRERAALSIVCLGVLFVLLEEIDYGLHYVEYLQGTGWQNRPRNLHNMGEANKYMKRAADLTTVLLFVVAPLWLPRWRSARLRRLAPPKIAIAGAVASAAVSRLAHFLQDTTEQAGSISKNISEFRELFLYMLLTAYVYDLSRRPGDTEHE